MSFWMLFWIHVLPLDIEILILTPIEASESRFGHRHVDLDIDIFFLLIDTWTLKPGFGHQSRELGLEIWIWNSKVCI